MPIHGKWLEKKYRHVVKDFEKAFDLIEKDYSDACFARPIPHFENKVWKYRCGSTHMRCGARDGFRIITFLDLDGTMYPIFAYTKKSRKTLCEARLNGV
jgi:hypothetical protein